MSKVTKSLGVLVALVGGSLLAGDWPPAGSTEETLVQYARTNNGDAKAGSAYFIKNRLGCLSCHGHPGAGGDIGPDLQGAGTRFDRETLMKKVLRPRPQSAMPQDFAKHFESADEFTNLIAYLEGLR